MHELLLHGAVPSNRHGQVLSILAGIAAMQPQPLHERRLIYKPTRPVTRPSMQVGGSQAVQSKQMNPMQTVQGAIQGDLFYLHLVEDLVVDSQGKGDMERKKDEEKTTGSEMMDSGDGGDEVWTSPFSNCLFISHKSCFMIISIIFSFKSNTIRSNHLILTTHTQQHQPSLPTSHPTAKPQNWTLQFRDIPEAGNRRPVTVRLIADVPITAGNAEAFMSALEYTSVPLPLLHTYTHTYTHIRNPLSPIPQSIPPTPH